MPSSIDVTKPVYGNPTTQSVRDNFTFAHDEITDLQNRTTGAPFLPISGGLMDGPITMRNDPKNPLEVATKKYVDDVAFSGGGTPEAPSDGMYYARGNSEVGQTWSSDPLLIGVKFGPNRNTTYFNISFDANYDIFQFTQNEAWRFNRNNNASELVSGGNVVQSWTTTATTIANLTATNIATIKGVKPTLHLSSNALDDEYIYFETNALKRWALGADAANTNFGIFCYDASGAIIPNQNVQISAVNGGVTINAPGYTGSASWGGYQYGRNLTLVSSSRNYPTLAFKNTAGDSFIFLRYASTIYLSYMSDDTNAATETDIAYYTKTQFTFNVPTLVNGTLQIVNGVISEDGTPTTASHVGNRGYNDGRYIQQTGGVINGDLTVSRIKYTSPPSGYGNHWFAIGWDGSRSHIYVDGTDPGPVVTLGADGSVTIPKDIVSQTGSVIVPQGNLYLGDNTHGGVFVFNGPAGIGRYLYLRDAGADQWVFGKNEINEFVLQTGTGRVATFNHDTARADFTGSVNVTSASDAKFRATGTGGDWPGVLFNAVNQGVVTGFFQGQRNGVARWQMQFGSTDQETGGNAGSDFIIQGHNDDGSPLPAYALRIFRASNLGLVSGDPTSPLGIATKQYCDTKLPLTGGTVTGSIIISSSNSSYQTFGIWNPTYPNGWGMALYNSSGNPGLVFGPIDQIGRVQSGKVYFYNSNVSINVLTYFGAGVTMNGGDLTLRNDPTSAMHAATKQYVDALRSYADGQFLPLTGGTVTGRLILNPDLLLIDNSNQSIIRFQVNGANRYQFINSATAFTLYDPTNLLIFNYTQSNKTLALGVSGGSILSNNGISFGTAVMGGTNTSTHITLHTAGQGIGATATDVRYVASGGHNFYANGFNALQIFQANIYTNAPLFAYADVTLSGKNLHLTVSGSDVITLDTGGVVTSQKLQLKSAGQEEINYLDNATGGRRWHFPMAGALQQYVCYYYDDNNAAHQVYTILRDGTGFYFQQNVNLAADPVNPLHASTKQYVDALRSYVAANYLPLIGGVMQGQIKTLPPLVDQDAANKEYVDDAVSSLTLYEGTWQVASNNPNISGGGWRNAVNYIAVTVDPKIPEVAPAGIPGLSGLTIHNGDRVIWSVTYSMWQVIQGGPVDIAAADARYVNQTGDTMTGPFILAADPLNPLGAATKQYCDNNFLTPAAGDARYVNVTGDTMSGGLSFGSAMAANANDLTRHIALYDGWGGFNITSGALNVVAGGAAVLTFNGPGISVAAGTSLYLAHDPTNAMEAATKAYADTKLSQGQGDARYLQLTGGNLSGNLNFTNNTGIQFNGGAGGTFQFVWDGVGVRSIVNGWDGLGNFATTAWADGRYLQLAAGGTVTGPTGFTNTLSLNGILQFGSNVTTVAGLGGFGAIVCNLTQGQGELDFVNLYYGYGGFRFYQVKDAAGATNCLLQIEPGGAIRQYFGGGIAYGGVSGGGNLIAFTWSANDIQAYVDGSHIGALAQASWVTSWVGSNYLSLTGGSLSGQLNIRTQGDWASPATWGLGVHSLGSSSDAIMGFDIAGVVAMGMGLDRNGLFSIGGWSWGRNRLTLDNVGNLNLAGALYLPGEPTTNNQAVTKYYSDRNKTRGLIDCTPGNITATVDQVDYAYIYCYGSPTGTVNITMPVATTVRVIWTINNASGQTIIFHGTGGGTVTIPPGASTGIWTDTAGIYPLYNANHQFKAINSGGGTAAAFVAQAGGNVTYTWYDTAAGADAKKWDLLVNNGQLLGRLILDNESNFNTWIEVFRAGATSSQINLNASVIYLRGITTVTGALNLQNGASFGSNVVTNPQDMSKQIALWGGQYGWSVTSNTLNHNTGGVHDFYSGATLVARMNAFGINLFQPVTLGGDPTATMHAATKQYVDSKVGAIPPPPDLSGYATTAYVNATFLPLSGGAINGPLHVNGNGISFDNSNWIKFLWDGAGIHSYVDNTDQGRLANQSWTIAYFLQLSGGVMTGALQLSGDPTAALHAATKQYVDNKVGGAGYLPLSGGTLTGALQIGAGDPQGSQLFVNGTALINSQVKSTCFLAVSASPPAATFASINPASGTGGGFWWDATNIILGRTTASGQGQGTGFATFGSNNTNITSRQVSIGSLPPTIPSDVNAGSTLTAHEIYLDLGDHLAWNCYIATTPSVNWKYIKNGWAGNLYQSATDGGIAFTIYPSGTAGAQVTNPVTWSFLPDGTLNMQGNIVVGALYGRNGMYPCQPVSPTYVMYNTAGSNILQMQQDWYWNFNCSNGDISWWGGGLWNQWRTSDWLIYNQRSTYAGYGNFIPLSDERAKMNVMPANVGLPEVLAMEPIKFTRMPVTAKFEDRIVTKKFDPEIGFSAQQLQRIIPDLVTVVGIELPDGSGGIDSDEPSLGIQTTAIIAALVNAVKELSARVQTLEAKQ